MKLLLLVKHSSPEVVEDVPAREWVLSGIGKVRAEKLAEQLRSYKPEIIVSSVEPKAIQTAEIVARRLALENKVFENLQEHDRRNSSYHSKDEFRRLVQEFFFQPDKLIFGSETAVQALDRFRTAVEIVLNQFDNKVIVIVAHGTVISLFAEWLTGCDGYDLWQKLDLPSFVIIDLQSKRLLEAVNLT